MTSPLTSTPAGSSSAVRGPPHSRAAPSIAKTIAISERVSATASTTYSRRIWVSQLKNQTM
ncbi:Uncharacterised protein [Mycobacteroides abscessus subsp. abscessus]|nr:Uncharacterised protein [Mycobacteroides abscessus subsp. abscessus]